MAVAVFYPAVRRRRAMWPVSRTRAFLTGALALDALFGLAYLATRGLSEPDSLVVMFDLNGEGNLPSWFASTQLLLAGLPWALLAAIEALGGATEPAPASPRTRRTDAVRRAAPPALLAALLVAMSADEGAQLHEVAGYALDHLTGPRAQGGLPATGWWMVVLGPPAALAIAMAVRGASRYLHRSGRLGLCAGGFALVLAGALGAEFTANFLGEGVLAQLEIAVEEVGELMGGTLLLTAGITTAAATVDVRVVLRGTDVGHRQVGSRGVDAHSPRR